MKLTKRFLCALLVLAMVLTVCPVIPFTATAAETVPTTEQPAYETKADGVYTGVAEDKVNNLTYLSADGDDEDTDPDLLIGYGNNDPKWNENYTGQCFISKGSVVKNGTVSPNNIKGVTTSNATEQDDIGYYRETFGAKYYRHRIYLGNNATWFENGIGVKPYALVGETDQQYVMFDVSDYDMFYSAIGLTYSAFNVNPSNILKGTSVDVNGATINGTRTDGTVSNRCGANSVVFYVYGSPNVLTEADAADESFVLLAESEAINGWETGEFNVDISDYKTLKLVTSGGATSVSGTDAAWGNASVYSIKVETNTDGVREGYNGKNVTFLSDIYDTKKVSGDAEFTLDSNYGSYYNLWTSTTQAYSVYSGHSSAVTDDNGETYYRTFSKAKYYTTELVLGVGADKFDKGFGVGITSGDKTKEMVLDISGLNAEYFYAVAGVTGGTNSNANKALVSMAFEVWGAADDDASFRKLAYIEGLSGGNIGEFNVNIEGYKYLKLVTISSGSTHHPYAAWGEACVYQKQDVITTGKPVGRPSNAYNVKPLSSDEVYSLVTASAGTINKNVNYHSYLYKFVDGVRQSKITSNKEIWLGYNSIQYDNGLSVHPDSVVNTKNNGMRYVTFDISSLNAERFYSVVGTCGENSTLETYGGTFQVWGGTVEGEWALLATVEDINSYLTAEFDVDISGYDYLKLAWKLSDSTTSNTSCGLVWADACVYNTNPMAGKTVSILGDSISTWTHIHNDITANTTIGNNAGYYGVGTCGLETRQDTWWQQVIDALDMELVVNNSWGGSCVWNPREGVDNQAGAPTGSGTRSQNLHNNNENTEEYPDVIFVFMGTNDFQYKSEEYPIGSTPADFEKVLAAGEPTSACEAYAIMLNNIQTAYPDAEVYCLTPLQETEEKDPDDTLKDWVASIKAIAAHFGCGVVDLYNDSGITTENLDIYTGDEKKIHPNCEGMDLITKAVLNVMLGETTELYDVSFDLENVESVDGHIAIAGDSYTATLRAAEKVKVTMGGEDITSSCYANGVVTIDKVTGDVEITASSDSVRVNTIGKNDSLNGRPASVNLQYLSALYNDSNYMISSNNPVKLNQAYSDPGYYFINGVHKSGDGGKTGDPDCVDAEGYRTFTLSDGTELKLHKLGINLGHTAVPYSSGLGVHPNTVGAEDRAIVYNVSDLGDRFYAVVGVNGYNITDPDYYSRYVNFEVWGSADGNSYERIAHALNVRAYLTAEFDLDISGYSYIKLVTRMNDESRNNWNCAAAWADACVYDLAIVNTSNNIRLQDSLKIGYFFTVDGSITPSSVGAKLWTAADYAAGKEGTDYANLEKVNGEYSVENAGVCPQDIGDVYVMVPYYVDGEGAYHYGEAVEYSVLEYCEKVYNMTEQDWTDKGQTAEKGAATKLIVIDLLNYATAASAYFDGTSAQAYNSFLKPEEQVVGWVEGTHSRENHPEDVINGTTLAVLDGRNINLNESTHLGIYLIDTHKAITEVSWRTEDGDVLTPATRDEENDRYVVTGILANHIYDNYYIRVSESEGYAEYGFCVAAYLTDLMTHPSYSGNTELVALCKAMQVYGYNAESYFTN